MFSVTAFRFSFTSSWKMLFLTLLSIGLFTVLGFWQLHRAAEKLQMIQAYHIQGQRPASILLEENVQQYQKITIKNIKQILPISFLLDNQQHDHHFGYDVLVPIVLSNNKVILLDRGWVSADPSRLSLPKIPALHYPGHALRHPERSEGSPRHGSMSQSKRSLATLGMTGVKTLGMTGVKTLGMTEVENNISGQVYFPSKKQWLLGPGLEVKNPQQVMIETLDLAMVSHFLHKSLYPFIIRQTSIRSDGLIRDWPVVTSAPQRHNGYALQWFAFAVIAGILYIGLNLKKLK